MLSILSLRLLISYEQAGCGVPLVLLHAFPQTSAMWRRQLDDLADDFRVLCPDLPGFGGSRSPSTCSIESMADDIAEWLKYLEIERAIIAGVSMGGYVALALARRHPSLLGGLILADTRADADSDEARAAREKMIEFARRSSARQVFEKMAPRLFCEQTRRERPQLVEESGLIVETIRPETILNALHALRDRPDARPELKNIQMPTLVLVGEHDEVSPLESALEMSRSIPRARLQVLADAGHYAHIEQAGAWSQAVREFAGEIHGGT